MKDPFGHDLEPPSGGEVITFIGIVLILLGLLTILW